MNSVVAEVQLPLAMSCIRLKQQYFFFSHIAPQASVQLIYFIANLHYVFIF